MPFWPLKVDNLFHVFPAFVKVQRKEVCPLYKILSTLAGVYAQWTTPRTCIDYQLECMLTATPVQAVHVRTERTIVNEPAKRRCVSPAPREFARNWDTRRLWLSTASRFSCKNTCRGDMYFLVSAVLLCSWFSRPWWNTSSLCRLVHDRPLSSNMYSLNWSGSSMHSNW